MKSSLKFYQFDTNEPSDCGQVLDIEFSGAKLDWPGVILEKGSSPHFYPKNVYIPYFMESNQVAQQLHRSVQINRYCPKNNIPYIENFKMTSIDNCHFCKIANNYPPAHIIYECSELIAFLDFTPIRESHTLIVTKQHFDYFDDLPQSISHKIIDLGQKIAKAQKMIYPVERAAFLFTGSDIAHVHAHVLPLFEKTDITSLQYIKDKNVEFEVPQKEDLDVLEKLTANLKSTLEKI